MRWNVSVVLLLALFSLLNSTPLTAADLTTLQQQLRSTEMQQRLEAVQQLARLGKEAVPVLLPALRDESPLVRAQVAAALGTIGDPSAADALAFAVKDEFSLVSVHAITALGKLKTPKATGVLLAVLADKQSPLRGQVIAAFGASDDPRVAEALLAVRNTAAVKAREDVLRALGRLKSEDARILDALLAAMGDVEPTVRLAAMEGLQGRKDPRVQKAALQAIMDADPAVRIAAIHTLKAFSEQLTYELLAKLLDDADPQVKLTALQVFPSRSDARLLPKLLPLAQGQADGLPRAALLALCGMDDPAVVPPLIQALANIDNDATPAVITALARLKDPRATEPLVNALGACVKEERYEYVSQIEQALRAIRDPRTVDLLIAALQAADREQVRWMMLDTLVGYGGAAAVPQLAKLLRGANGPARQMAAYGLTRLGPAGVTALFVALGEDNTGVQQPVLTALNDAYDPAVVPALVEGLTAEQPLVRRTAALTLARLGDERAKDTLATFLTIEDLDMRRQIIFALANLHDTRAIEPLAGMIQEADPQLRLQAASALARLGDMRALNVLLPIVQGEPQRGRTEAINAVAGMKDTEAVDGLMAALKRPDTRVPGTRPQPILIGALLRTGDRRATQTALEALAPHLRMEYISAYLEPNRDITRVLKLSPEELKYGRSLMRQINSAGNIAVEPFVDTFRHPLPEMRAAALLFLQRRQYIDSRLLPHLTAMLTDVSPEVRVLATQSLAQLGDVRALQPLLPSLKDTDARVRQEAAHALVKIQARRACDALFAAQQAGSSTATEALAELGDMRAFEPLVKTVLAAKERDRWRVSNSLFSLLANADLYDKPAGIQKYADQLLGLLRTGDAQTAYWSGSILASLRDPRAITTAVAMLQSTDKEKQQIGVGQLNMYADASAAQPLMDYVRKCADEPGRARGAIRALGRIDTPESRVFIQGLSGQQWFIPVLSALYGREHLLSDAMLLDMLRSADGRTIFGLERPLMTRLRDNAEFAGQALGLLQRYAQSADDNIRLTAVRLLSATKKPEASELLLTMVTDADINVRQAAVQGLVEMKERRVLPMLVEMLDDRATRRVAATQLGKLGDPQAIAPLKATLADKDVEFIVLVASALGRLGDTSGLELLLAQARKGSLPAIDGLGYSTDARAKKLLMDCIAERAPDVPASESLAGVRLAAVNAIQQQGGAQAVDVLIAALETGDMEFRKAVVSALGALKDHRAVEPLIGALEHFAGHAAQAPADALKAITGEDFGKDAAKWRGWWVAQH